MDSNIKPNLEKTNNYKLTVNGKTGFVINGLKNVVKTSPEFVCAELGNAAIEIYGKNFKVSKLSVSDGVLEVDGEITDFRIKPGKDNTPFFKRIFK